MRERILFNKSTPMNQLELINKANFNIALLKPFNSSLLHKCNNALAYYRSEGNDVRS